MTVVVPYDTAWPALFEAERLVLAERLAPWLAGGIHHIGSTAVPGLAAKPLIDMIAGVRDLEASRAAFASLTDAGYIYREHRPEAHSFLKRLEPDGAASHHLHLTEPESPLWAERIAFRDALRTDPALAAEYADWKHEHLAGPGATSPYTASKTPFVARVLTAVGIDLKPDSERLTVSYRSHS